MSGGFTCLVCGYPDLHDEPFCSYEICPCCGVEFGFEDEGLDEGTEALRERHLALRALWLHASARWVNRSKRPGGWSAEAQLLAAGFDIPEEAERLRLIDTIPSHLRRSWESQR